MPSELGPDVGYCPIPLTNHFTQGHSSGGPQWSESSWHTGEVAQGGWDTGLEREIESTF